MKSVLISIHPEWCEKIAGGEKTVEVRRTRPSIATPFPCFIYESAPVGKVIGEFVCDHIAKYALCGTDARNLSYQQVESDFTTKPVPYDAMCLSRQEFSDYGDRGVLYGWHISDLVIYDQPRELGEFKRRCNGAEKETDPKCVSCDHLLFDNDGPAYHHRFCETSGRKSITRPPQSWCYVEEVPKDG